MSKVDLIKLYFSSKVKVILGVKLYLYLSKLILYKLYLYLKLLSKVIIILGVKLYLSKLILYTSGSNTRYKFILGVNLYFILE